MKAGPCQFSAEGGVAWPVFDCGEKCIRKKADAGTGSDQIALNS